MLRGSYDILGEDGVSDEEVDCCVEKVNVVT